MVALAFVGAGSRGSVFAGVQESPTGPSPLTRHYQEGERLSYRMTATNRDRTRTTTYEATVRGEVKRDSAGRFFEEYQWSDLVWNGTAFELPPASQQFRQLLSLAPDYTPALPDFSQMHPRLVGPTADLMTFYSDVWLAIQQPKLRRAADHAVVNHAQASSWADGTRILLGEDAIDFAITLDDLATSGGFIVLTVRHVVPEQPRIKIPAAWMHTRVANVPNNWVQVAKAGERRYIASIGKETFDAQIRLHRVTRKIVTAHLENPVEVFERECTDAALLECGEGVRYGILRRIDITEIPESF